MRVGLLCAMVFAVFTLFLASTALATDDAVKASPDHYKVLLSNEEVRVLDFTGKAGDKIPLHSHPDHVAYVVKGGKAKFTADGKTTEMDMKDGQAIFLKAGDHSVEIVGPGEVHVIVVEMTEEMKK